jgi:serine/threonine protein kinase
MADSFYLDIGQSIQSESGWWYRNLQVLGTGGNAVTFLAMATSGPHRGVPFAIKVFRKLSKPERRDNFLKEMRFLKACEHPSIMRIYDAGVFYKDHPFYVAEYLPNTLRQIMRFGDRSIVERISYALQLLSALSYLASLTPRVIHRDIKPQNIFIKGRSCVLGDFGLMKQVEPAIDEDSKEFKESVGVGMPFRYRTPDQVAYLNQDVALTCASDVFQLGLVLAELFTGRNPELPTDDFNEEVKLEPLGTIHGSLSAPIANVINRMLGMDPASRGDAYSFLAPWEGIFKNAVTKAHALEGRAIW